MAITDIGPNFVAIDGDAYSPRTPKGRAAITRGLLQHRAFPQGEIVLRQGVSIEERRKNYHEESQNLVSVLGQLEPRQQAKILSIDNVVWRLAANDGHSDLIASMFKKMERMNQISVLTKDYSLNAVYSECEAEIFDVIGQSPKEQRDPILVAGEAMSALIRGDRAEEAAGFFQELSDKNKIKIISEGAITNFARNGFGHIAIDVLRLTSPARQATIFNHDFDQSGDLIAYGFGRPVVKMLDAMPEPHLAKVLAYEGIVQELLKHRYKDAVRLIDKVSPPKLNAVLANYGVTDTLDENDLKAFQAKARTDVARRPGAAAPKAKEPSL